MTKRELIRFWQPLVKNAAKDGANYLDGISETWYERINTKTLKLANCDICVLGQLCLDYSVGVRALELTNEQTEDYGFTLNSNLMEDIEVYANARGGVTADVDYYGLSSWEQDQVLKISDEMETHFFDYLTTCWVREINKRKGV
jgi:hypothetical protein